MKAEQCDNQRKAILLAERIEHVADLCFQYRLEMTCGYRISARCGAEERTLVLGSDLARAWSFFSAVADGLVTPCTLADVWEDFTYGELTK
jgi:hypothetical protein